MKNIISLLDLFYQHKSFGLVEFNRDQEQIKTKAEFFAQYNLIKIFDIIVKNTNKNYVLFSSDDYHLLDCFLVGVCCVGNIDTFTIVDRSGNSYKTKCSNYFTFTRQHIGLFSVSMFLKEYGINSKTCSIQKKHYSTSGMINAYRCQHCETLINQYQYGAFSVFVKDASWCPNQHHFETSYTDVLTCENHYWQQMNRSSFVIIKAKGVQLDAFVDYFAQTGLNIYVYENEIGLLVESSTLTNNILLTIAEKLAHANFLYISDNRTTWYRDNTKHCSDFSLDDILKYFDIDHIPSFKRVHQEGTNKDHYFKIEKIIEILNK